MHPAAGLQEQVFHQMGEQVAKKPLNIQSLTLVSTQLNF
jgi:hypothetical protein